MILALNGRGEIIGQYNDNGTPYQDPSSFGVYDNAPYFPNSGGSGSGGSGVTFGSVSTAVVNVLKALFPFGVGQKAQNTAYDPYTPTTGTIPQTQTPAYSGLGWVVAFLVLAYFLFSGKKK